MKTKKEYELEIVDFFNKHIKDSLEKKLINSEHIAKNVVIPYVYFDVNDKCDFNINQIIDYAVWNVNKQKFTEIEYPWNNKKGELQYNTIKL